MENERACGILLPVSSLPSKYGIGCFSNEAYEFVDQLAEAGQSFWQILPLGPTGYGDSPYQSFSTFAGNPYFISLEGLIGEGVLTLEECEQADFGEDPSQVDYGKLYQSRYILLRKAYERSDIAKDPLFSAFMEKEGWWVSDYALFMAVKSRFGDVAYSEWDADIRQRRPHALSHYRKELYEDIGFQEYMQYKFYQQWGRLKTYANQKGIRIIGDIPIYVAMDSADTWANPGLFRLDEELVPTHVAGCPPDGFSETGQLWGNPLYRWEEHEKTDFSWWRSRLAHSFSLYDVVRIDHFRGFDEYYVIPYGDKDARGGWWEKGPGIGFFRAAGEELEKHEVIAEDLGYMTDSVRQLVKDTGFPNMKVLEFAFDSRDTGSAADYLPHNYPENCVVYTGTHDNETLLGWFADIRKEEQEMVRAYLNNYHDTPEELCQDMIVMAMRSVARICVIPLQDYLGLDNRARINQPSTLGKNWKWRLLPGQLDQAFIRRLSCLARLYGRERKG